MAQCRKCGSETFGDLCAQCAYERLRARRQLDCLMSDPVHVAAVNKAHDQPSIPFPKVCEIDADEVIRNLSRATQINRSLYR